jgi:hypothetical protein
MPEVNKGIMNYGSIGGDAKVSSVVTHTGDNVSVHASGSAVNVKSRLEHVTQAASRDRSDDRLQREKLNELFQQLQAALSQIPNTHRDSAEAIARQAQVLADAANGKSPSKTFIQVSGEALKATAKFVSDVAPSVAGIITAIVSAIGALS